MIPTPKNASYELTLRAVRGTLGVLVVLHLLALCQMVFFTIAPAVITNRVYQEDSIFWFISSVYWLVHLLVYLSSFILLVYLFHPRLQLSRTRVVSTVTLFYVLVQIPLSLSVISWNVQNVLFGPAANTAPTQLSDWLGVANSFAHYLEPVADVLFATVLVCVILRKKLGWLFAFLIGFAILGFYPVGWILNALPFDFNDPASLNRHIVLTKVIRISMLVVTIAAAIALWKQIDRLVPPPHDDNSCPSCGYSTLGLKGTTCPECGGVIPHPSAGTEG